ncbi:MAG TPA: hypothetical protein PLX15_00960 [Candidatus Woesearchaeota archaeon]|nr:hypothetical protein [Candidatus Woesearchaeota archaeon]
MKYISCDAGPIISLSMNNLLWVLKELKKKDVSFCIGSVVKSEMFDKPINIRRFKLKAIQVLDLISEGVISLIDIDTKIRDELMTLSNNIFYAYKRPIPIVHNGEIETLAMYIEKSHNALLLDERTMRLLIESPLNLKTILASKLHTKIKINYDALDKFQNIVKTVKIIRSSELLISAYSMGMFNCYLEENQEKTLPNIKEQLLDGLLWGVKLSGCSISEDEIHSLKKHALAK